MRNIITNEGAKNLGERLKELINYSTQIDILVGFFYFSGLDELYTALKENKDLKLRILVGLAADDLIVKLTRGEERDFLEILKRVIQTEDFDNEETYKKYRFYLKLIEEGRLILRKTKEPNHAKLYIFHTKEEYKNLLKGAFITGSSNLTRSGLKLQNEFNVEIKDWGYEYATEYFERLWKTSEEISENDDKKRVLIEIIENSPVSEIDPFTAYVFTLKNYIETLKLNKDFKGIKFLLESRGYHPYTYQVDAIVQALEIIDRIGGVILADVVGLGKSVIASAIANLLGKRGIVIAPPHLIGSKSEKTGWYKYLSDFGLLSLGWEAFSLGKLEDALNFLKNEGDVEVVIVDEAHRFRNEDTKNYELLNAICKNRKVILLTATPFNNRPSDILALLKLITPPKKSPLAVNGDIKTKFENYERLFKKLTGILKNYTSQDKKRRNKALRDYKEIFKENKIDVDKVKIAIHQLAQKIRATISPVVIRRNRLDLQKHPLYAKEVRNLPKVEDPKPVFYELTPEQSKFYDELLEIFLPPEEGGKFTGAIYIPIYYEKRNSEEEENFDYWIQKNLNDFMRRLLVRRLESSFGAFKDSIENFLKVHRTVYEFIKTHRKYFLERNLIEKVMEGELELDEALEMYRKRVEERKLDERYHKVYELEKLEREREFLRDIRRDIEILEYIEKKIEEVGLSDHQKDPKAEKLIEIIERELKEGRKVVIFTEFTSTAQHLEKILKEKFPEKVLTAYGNISASKIKEIYENFDASYDQQRDKYEILLATDKLSEGFNLNRAGTVINYDIPWNPVRLIQRIGRVNRIGKKVYDRIRIYNFFPTEIGADITKSKEIAGQKLLMIHRILGEDSKILEPEEEPSPSKLYDRLNRNPELFEEESFETKLLNEWERIKKEYPQVVKRVEELPNRIKTAKRGKHDKVLTFVRKQGIFFCIEKQNNNLEPEEKTFQEVYEDIKCKKNETKLKLSPNFWRNYEIIKKYINGQLTVIKQIPYQSLENKAIENLKLIKKNFHSKLPDDLVSFIEFLEEEIKNYGSISKYTLRILSRLKANDEESLKVLEDLKNKFSKLKLNRANEKQEQNKNIIISFEIQS
jgi:SNF2 family DNA or RNA helicase